MHILDDDTIVSEDVLIGIFEDVVTLAKAAVIPDVKRIHELSEILDDKIRLRKRLMKDIAGLSPMVGLSKATAKAILSRHGLTVDIRLTLDKSEMNRVAVFKHVTQLEVSTEQTIRELWATIQLLAKDVPGPDHTVELNTVFRSAIEKAIDADAILDYVNTDTVLAKKTDIALAKQKAGKQNSMVRIICDAKVETAYDFIQLLAKYNPINKVVNGYERVKEVADNEWGICDMDNGSALLLKYARDIKDYNTVVKWSCTSIIKGVLK